MTLLSFFSFGCDSTPQFRSVEVEEFAKVIECKDVILVDVRRAEEWSEGHLPKAQLNIDALKEDFIELAEASLPKDKTIAIYCRSGRRSKDAANRLANSGFDVVELDSGILGWQASGRKVVK